MNRKTIFSLAFAALAGTAMAYESGVKIIRIALTSTANDILVAVPAVTVGGSAETIDPTKFVLPDNMADGDTLYAKCGGVGYTWTFDASEGAWTENANIEYPESPAADRGSAIRVKRTTASNNPIYAIGQFGTGACTVSSTAGTKKAPVYTMMGNIKDTSVDMTALAWQTNPSAGDAIAVPVANGTGMTTYTYSSSGAWQKTTRALDDNGILTSTKADVAAGEVVFAPGQGFWYVSKGGAAVLSWPAAE